MMLTMWTRREQHQAYQFLTRRIVSAILSGEPETNELPMRRFAVTLLAGIAVAVLVIAGFGVYGLLFPGGGRPAENAIILERETGAKYVYLQGQLHPVLNWTSARLIVGADQPAVRTLSRASLRDVPRGRPVGIPDAPDALPDKGSLLALPWSVCSTPRSATSVALATHVLVGQVPAGGVALGDDEGVLVTSGGSPERYLIWRDHRLRLPDNATIAALGWSGIRPASVSAPFLDTLPAGPDLAPPAIARTGERAGHTVAGAEATIGQLFRVSSQDYVMLPEGLAPVGKLSVRLWAASGRRITETSAQEVGRLLLNSTVEPPGLPAEVPAAHGADDRFTMACLAYRGAQELERPVTVESFAAVAAGMSLPDQGALPESTGADRVVLPGGRGALVATLTSPGAVATGNVYLLTDQGIKYPLPRAELDKIQTSLGYGGVRPVVVPGSILDLVPTGPALDPAAARRFATAATPDPGPSR
jgi:type VII secretion protein EccB